MRKDYAIDGLVWDSSNFFYLYNWKMQNIISLFGTSDETESFRNNTNCVGMWKIKKQQ